MNFMTTVPGVACTACGADASQRTSDQPCQTCGATARTHSVTAILTATATLTAVASVGYFATPTWERQWFELRAAYDAIADYYTGTPKDNQDAARTVRDGCLAAWSLAEHMADIKAGMAYRERDPALRDASDLINTWKHAGRRARYTRGRIADDHGYPDGTRAIELEFIDPEQPPRRRDALDLLRSCLDSWATYLRAEGFTVEWPPSSP